MCCVVTLVLRLIIIAEGMECKVLSDQRIVLVLFFLTYLKTYCSTFGSGMELINVRVELKVS